MYSIRPHISETIELDLPTTMYPVRPIINQQAQTNQSAFKDIEKRQDHLLEKLTYLYNQLALYQKHESNAKAAAVPIREALVVHLSAKKPSKNILNLIEQFRDKVSIRSYRHSSLGSASMENFSSTNNQNNNRSLTIIWADHEDLPFMFHSHMKINDEQSIVNLLSHHLTNGN